jgi:CelD/BcsL family acetyltransferase involved in cellulose biosynthesis
VTAGLRLEVAESLEPLREDWARLAPLGGNVFGTWEWNELWWRFFGRGRRLAVGVALDEHGEARAVVPVYLWRRRPLRVLRFVGHGPGDLLGPVYDRREPEIAAEALRLTLRHAPSHDLFVGDWLLADRDWEAALGGRILRETGYPILRLEAGSWDEFLASRSRNFRKSVGRHARRLERGHVAESRLASDPATLDADLDAAFALHRARFGAHPGCYFCGESEAFQRAFAARALAQGWLRLRILTADGRPVAMEYGFQYAGSYFAYQTGRDPAWDGLSVGDVLEFEALRSALEDGAREYRYMEGEEPYKYRLANDDPELEAIGVARTATGRLALTSLRTARHIRPLTALAKRLGR